MMKTTQLATVHLVQDADGGLTACVQFADWIDMISPTEAHELLQLASKTFEAESMPYYIRSQGPEGR